MRLGCGMKKAIFRVELSESLLKEMMKQYHINTQEYKEVFKVYHTYVRNLKLHVFYDDCEEGRSLCVKLDNVNGFPAIFSYMEEAQSIEEKLSDEKNIMGQYYFDCILLKAMEVGYAIFGQLYQEKTGRVITEMKFIGDEIPIQKQVELLACLRPEGIEMNESYVFIPKKTIGTILLLQDENNKANCVAFDLCKNCNAKTCERKMSK